MDRKNSDRDNIDVVEDKKIEDYSFLSDLKSSLLEANFISIIFLVGLCLE